MNSRKLTNLFAYIAIILIAVSLIAKYLVSNIFNLSSNISYWCGQVAYYLACLATIVCAFAYAQSRRNVMFMAFLVIAIGVIIVFTFVL